MTDKQPGKIITFYSYKGGTGRSMALANIAWILASEKKRVLVLDWDLEAPGLHRYFRPFLLDKELTASEGIIDFVTDFAAEAITPLEEGEKLSNDWYVSKADILEYVVSLNWKYPAGGALDFIPAGQQGPVYATRFSTFNWRNFYDRLGGGAVIEAAKEQMRANYDYILIDSRTGVSDTAGICTVQMPDTLAVCFTYNNQSIEGAAAVAQSVLEQRSRQTDGKSPYKFKVFPIPMRVTQDEKDRLDIRRKYAWKLFDPLVQHIEAPDRGIYWNGAEVPHLGYFSYEEILSPFREDPNDPKLVLSAMVRITGYLTDHEVKEFNPTYSPEEKQQVLGRFAETPLTGQASAAQAATETRSEERVRGAEATYKDLSPEDQEAFKRMWTRLIRVARPNEGGGNTPLQVKVKDLVVGEDFLEPLIKAGLLRKVAGVRDGAAKVEIAHEDLIRDWKRSRDWTNEDREYLVWRQKFSEELEEWEKNGRHRDFLLRKGACDEALTWLKQREDYFTDEEKAYISASDPRAKGPAWHERFPLAKIFQYAFLALVLAAIVFTFLRQQAESARRQREERAATLASDGLQALADGDYNQAIPAFTEAIKLNPESAEAHLNRGDAYLKSEAYDQAIADYTESIRLGRDNARAYTNRGIAFFQTGKTGEAINDFNDSIKLKPANAEAYVYRGNAYGSMGDTDRAIADFSKALDFDANNGNALFNLGILYAKQGEKQKARDYFQNTILVTKDAKIASDARDNLKALGQTDATPVPQTAAPVAPRIYLQFNGPDDKDKLNNLSKALAGSGFNVMGPAELRKETTAGDVRYYYPEDKDNASKILSKAQQSLAQMGFKVNLQLLKLAERFSNVRRGHVEVWVPALQPPQQQAYPQGQDRSPAGKARPKKQY
jgi:tetratricopeptide (TPR) repeat protein/Mrp family chromosome partitioning ATPase